MKLILKLFLYMIVFIAFPFELAISLICLLFGIKLYKKGIKNHSFPFDASEKKSIENLTPAINA